MKDGHLNSCKECRKAYQQSRPYDKERERNQTEKRKAYHAANLKRWRRENPHKLAVQLARRRARKLEAEGDFTVEEFEALCERYGDVCLRCGDGDALLTPDHVVPLSLGGSNLIENIQLYAAPATPGRTARSSTTVPLQFRWASPDEPQVPRDEPEKGKIIRFFKG